MSIQPLNDKIAVTRFERVKQTSSGLFIPDSTAELPDQGKVIAVGTGKVLTDGKIIEPVVQVGDHVVFAKNAGQVVKIDGVEVIMMREEDILGVVR